MREEVGDVDSLVVDSPIRGQRRMCIRDGFWFACLALQSLLKCHRLLVRMGSAHIETLKQFVRASVL